MNWSFLTFFGDSMLLLPSAVIIFILLMSSYASRKPAGQWIMVFGNVGSIVCLSKLAFMGWGIGSREYDFTGFSGHSALSATILPVMLWVLSGRFSTAVGRIAVSCGYMLALAVGYSRLVIHVHSTSEVVAGLALGFVASSIFLLLQRHRLAPSLSYQKSVCALILPLLLINTGKAAPTQGLLERIAITLASVATPYTRADLQSSTTTDVSHAR
ncbi:phosphatase PAP2 family protein [Ewingella sp. S1.OA.A_B6]